MQSAEYDIRMPADAPLYHPRQDPDIILGKTGAAASDQFQFRVRLVTDHRGVYQVETVMPPPYYDPDDEDAPGVKAWRCPHIHMFVQPEKSLGVEPLITQVYFENAEYNDTDKHFNAKTMIKNVVRHAADSTRGCGSFSQGRFDIVLARSGFSFS